MKKFLMAALLIMAMALTGCGGEENSSSGGNGKLSIMLGSNVVSLDSAQATDSASFEVIADCIDGLMQLDAEGKPVPALAESYDVSEDGKTYTFPRGVVIVKWRRNILTLWAIRLLALKMPTPL